MTNPRARRWTSAIAAIIAVAFTASCSSGSKVQERTFRMGERAEVGQLIYTVMEAEWQNQLGQGLDARVPEHRFLIIHLSVTNSGITESAIPPFTLTGASGETYPELSNGKGVSQWLGFLRSLKPSATEHGRVLFDVPPGAYRLRVTNDAEPESEIAALIEIPFQVAPATPQIPFPASAPLQ